MARARYAATAFTRTGLPVSVVPNPEILLMEPGTTTPLAATIYAGATGGATLTNPFFGDSDGNYEFYLATAQDIKVVATGVGVGTITDDWERVQPAVSDLILKSTANLLSGDAYFQVKHAGEGTYGGLWYGRANADPANPRYALILSNQGNPAATGENSSLVVAQTKSGHWVNIVSGVTVGGLGPDLTADSGAARFTAATDIAGTVALRASEHHVFRYTPATAWNTMIFEAGMHSQVTGAHPLHNVGMYMYNEDWDVGHPVVRADTGYALLGTRGWKHFAYYVDTDNTTVLLDIDQNGHITGGNVVPRATATYQCGTASRAWLLVNSGFFNTTGDGSAAAPVFARAGVGTAGLYFASTGSQVGLTVGASDTALLTSTGLTLSKMLVLPQVATPSAPGTNLTGLYSKTGGGLYSRANGGSEQQHKAGGQFGFASGVTNSPTTTSISYSDLAEMTVTLTTTGGDLLCWFAGAFAHSDATKAIQIAFSLDGAAEVGAFSLNEPVANKTFLGVGLWRFTGVSAGSHTVKIRWLTDGATATANGGQRQILVLETPH